MVSVQAKIAWNALQEAQTYLTLVLDEKTLLLIVDFIIAFDMVYYEILFRKLEHCEVKIWNVLHHHTLDLQIENNEFR